MNLVKHWAAQLDDYAIDLSWSPDGTLLAAASAAGPLSLFSSTDGACRCRLDGHEDGSNVLAWSPDGRVLASGGQDGNVKFWDPAAGAHVSTTPIGRGWVEHLSWRPGKEGVVLAASAGKSLSFLKPDASVARQFLDAPKTISALAWHPTGA